MTTTTTRTRADRIQQLADFLAAHPEVDADLSDNSINHRPVLHFHPKSAADVKTLIAALDTTPDDWDRSSISSGFVHLDSGALGYASIFVQLPRVVQPARVVAPEVAELFA
ncbi:hypothetical protein ACTJKO_07810 [Curtobacterium sp. 22159]|uniref:hypothetical protein n=1 Tax=Curtobacterium sp. 22159 TaxID=3453882 RepID=UPI003F83DB15